MNRMKRLYLGGLASIPDEAGHPFHDLRTPEERDRDYTGLFETGFIVPSQEMYDMSIAEGQGVIEYPIIQYGWRWVDPGGANQASNIQSNTAEWFRTLFGEMQEQ